jgi:UDP-N-acetyl-D-glucosamine/UDP-N-acetyl-D-galactosamine dehydrogenase
MAKREVSRGIISGITQLVLSPLPADMKKETDQMPVQKRKPYREKVVSDTKDRVDKATVCIVGLGYVGLPLVEAFAKKLKVIGYDINARRVAELSHKFNVSGITFTSDPVKIHQSDFTIICVPTPVTKMKEPDLSLVESAAATVGRNLKRRSVVILESTVYPGVTEEIVGPILERESGLKCGRDFKIAYAPERVNPGDTKHTIDKITKVVSGMDAQTRDLVAELYGRIIPDIFLARDIQTAEAAKVIENIQRDLNIALMNELSLIFEKLHLDTKDVLDAASTKWNFHRYAPGLVGGHCIPVDPYYLVRRARELGYHSQVISAGRAINDSMAKHVAEMTVRALNEVGKVIKGSKVLIIGLTYKENVADTRETPQKHVIEELKEYGIEPVGYDPLLDITEAEKEFGVKMLPSLKPDIKFDGIILAVAHDVFKDDLRGVTLKGLAGVMNRRPVLIDIRRFFDGSEAMKKGFFYRTL